MKKMCARACGVCSERVSCVSCFFRFSRCKIQLVKNSSGKHGDIRHRILYGFTVLKLKLSSTVIKLKLPAPGLCALCPVRPRAAPWPRPRDHLGPSPSRRRHPREVERARRASRVAARRAVAGRRVTQARARPL